MSTYEQVTNYAKATLDELDAQLVQAQADLTIALSDVDEWKKSADGLAGQVQESAVALKQATALVTALTAERDALQAKLEALEPAPEPVEQPTDGLWFKLPDDIRGHARKVFGHYFGPYPRSLDNAPRDTDYYTRGYLSPSGESGKHAAYGGFLRNRPVGRPAIAGDYLIEDCKFDIRAAAAAGHDGFLCDIMGETGASMDRYLKLRDAATALNLPGFYVVPMLDCNGDLSKSYAAGTRTADQVAAKLAQFSGKPCTWYLDGKFVISSFKAEGLTAAQWQGILDALARAGVPSVFLSVALDFSKSAGLASATVGEGSWGFGADPGCIRGASNQTAASHGRGKAYVFPITSQGVRPAGGVFDEACNTEAHRASWDKAIGEGADYAQHVTWSDFSEGAECVPSEARGWAVLDLDAWYLTAWKTGAEPAILTDAVILSHRSNPVGSTPTGPQTKTMQHWVRGNRSALRDTVEALVFLTAPAVVRITTGAGVRSFDAPAGQSAWLAPLAVGSPPKVEIVRGGVVVAQVTSVVPVVDRPVVDDRQYYWFSSLRGTAGQRTSVTL